MSKPEDSDCCQRANIAFVFRFHFMKHELVAAPHLQCDVIMRIMFQICFVIYLAGLSLAYLPVSGQSALAS